MITVFIWANWPHFINILDLNTYTLWFYIHTGIFWSCLLSNSKYFGGKIKIACLVIICNVIRFINRLLHNWIFRTKANIELNWKWLGWHKDQKLVLQMDLLEVLSYEYLGRDKRETESSAPCNITNLFHSGPQPDSSGQSSLPTLRRCIFLYLN